MASALEDWLSAAGDAEIPQERLEASLEACRSAADDSRQQMESDPSNPEWQYGYACNLLTIAGLQAKV